MKWWPHKHAWEETHRQIFAEMPKCNTSRAIIIPGVMEECACGRIRIVPHVPEWSPVELQQGKTAV